MRGNPNSWVLAEEIAERAHRGEIHIWGKCPPTARHSPIPPDHWRLEAVAMESLCNEASEVKTSKRGPLAKDRYWHLMINRAEFEREWPRNA